MALKIRLRQQGRRNRLTYRLVVADSRLPRDGKYLENLGHYDPHHDDEKRLSVNEERVDYWLGLGAEITGKAQALVASASPGVIKAWKERQVAKRVKENAKRRAAKKKSA